MKLPIPDAANGGSGGGGTTPDVDVVYECVLRDKRHMQIFTISRAPIKERSFPDRTMDFATIDRVEAGEIIGDPSAFLHGSCLRLDAHRANRLIAARRRPKWRQRDDPYKPLIRARGGRH